MSRQSSVVGLATLIAVVWLVQLPLAGQAPAARGKAGTSTSTPLRTPDGQPDLQGIWNNTVTTPLERPSAVAGTKEYSDEELAKVTTALKRARDDRNRRDQSPGAVTDVGRAYGALWFPVPGQALKRTSLITDPPDGKVPPLTEEAKKRFARWAEAKGRFGPAATPEGVFVEGVVDGTQGGRRRPGHSRRQS
jgi:hypothetical protein